MLPMGLLGFQKCVKSWDLQQAFTQNRALIQSIINSHPDKIRTLINAVIKSDVIVSFLKWSQARWLWQKSLVKVWHSLLQKKWHHIFALKPTQKARNILKWSWFFCQRWIHRKQERSYNWIFNIVAGRPSSCRMRYRHTKKVSFCIFIKAQCKWWESRWAEHGLAEFPQGQSSPSQFQAQGK